MLPLPLFPLEKYKNYFLKFLDFFIKKRRKLTQIIINLSPPYFFSKGNKAKILYIRSFNNVLKHFIKYNNYYTIFDCIYFIMPYLIIYYLKYSLKYDYNHNILYIIDNLLISILKYITR
jgi:hypothetical protein